LSEETFDLLDAFADFIAVLGRQIVEREREERFHLWQAADILSLWLWSVM
jgi:nicotinamide riboside transporter PnuC